MCCVCSNSGVGVCLQYTVHVVTIYGIDAVANEIDVVLKLLLVSFPHPGLNVSTPTYLVAKPTREIVHQYVVCRNEDYRPLI